MDLKHINIIESRQENFSKAIKKNLRLKKKKCKALTQIPQWKSSEFHLFIWHGRQGPVIGRINLEGLKGNDEI